MAYTPWLQREEVSSHPAAVARREDRSLVVRRRRRISNRFCERGLDPAHVDTWRVQRSKRFTSNSVPAFSAETMAQVQWGAERRFSFKTITGDAEQLSSSSLRGVRSSFAVATGNSWSLLADSNGPGFVAQDRGGNGLWKKQPSDQKLNSDLISARLAATRAG